MHSNMFTSSGPARDHGGGLDAAMAQYGGRRQDWIDLSTGINPFPYPVPSLQSHDWTALPDSAAQTALVQAARAFWNVPEGAAILPAPGASALIARIPSLASAATVRIKTPTYNEHAAAFEMQGWHVIQDGPAQAQVLVHPNNPDGRVWSVSDLDTRLTIIDESFCDVMPSASMIELSTRPNTIVLKSFGKFWGLAGVRLGFAVAPLEVIDRLAALTGPWAVSGPALRIGAAALTDTEWATATRARLTHEAQRLDRLMKSKGAAIVGGTDLFRLYRVNAAHDWQFRLAQHHIWSRIFPYSDTFLRLGLPPAQAWPQLEAAL